MGDILKEAIADAKAVRETALENAKIALEEAFAPRIQSMLSAKLKEDEFEDEEEKMGDEEPGEEDGEEMEMSMPTELGSAYEDEMGGEEEDPVSIDDIPAVGDEEVPGEEEPDMEEEGVIEINGVKYAPVVLQKNHLRHLSKGLSLRIPDLSFSLIPQ